MFYRNKIKKICTLLLFTILCINYAAFCQKIIFKNTEFPPRASQSKSYYLREQKQLSWVLKNDINTKEIGLVTNRERLSGCVYVMFADDKVDTFSVDSVVQIPDSIIRLKKPQKLSIQNNGLSYISANLSQLPKLRTLEVNTFGQKKGLYIGMPKLKHVKKICLLSSDSATIANVLLACPNVKRVEMHVMFLSQWNVKEIFQYNPKIRSLIVPYWEGLTNSYTGIDISQDYYNAIQLDLELNYLKHLRKIESNYRMSINMQKYCEKHRVKVKANYNSGI